MSCIMCGILTRIRRRLLSRSLTMQLNVYFRQKEFHYKHTFGRRTTTNDSSVSSGEQPTSDGSSTKPLSIHLSACLSVYLLTKTPRFSRSSCPNCSSTHHSHESLTTCQEPTMSNGGRSSDQVDSSPSDVRPLSGLVLFRANFHGTNSTRRTATTPTDSIST